jgi:hypothetical protein
LNPKAARAIKKRFKKTPCAVQAAMPSDDFDFAELNEGDVEQLAEAAAMLGSQDEVEDDVVIEGPEV